MSLNDKLIYYDKLRKDEESLVCTRILKKNI